MRHSDRVTFSTVFMDIRSVLKGFRDAFKFGAALLFLPPGCSSPTAYRRAALSVVIATNNDSGERAEYFAQCQRSVARQLTRNSCWTDRQHFIAPSHTAKYRRGTFPEICYLPEARTLVAKLPVLRMAAWFLRRECYLDHICGVRSNQCFTRLMMLDLSSDTNRSRAESW